MRGEAPSTFGSGIDEESLLAALEAAVKVGVLEERSRPGAVLYRFAHAFFRQTLYEEISPPRRIRWHQQVARALETGSLAVFALAFLAVGREGVETALFMVGYAEAQTAWPLIGLVIGVLAAAAIAYGMYRKRWFLKA